MNQALLSVKRFLSVIFVLGLTVFLSGCQNNKPYTLTVNKINETGPQAQAVITLSDPQIYQRETLINDRLREAKLIKKLLAESEQIGNYAETEDFDFRARFSPQISRDIQTYSALSIGLRAGFNQQEKQANSRQQELDDLDHQIALAQKRKVLEDLLKDDDNPIVGPQPAAATNQSTIAQDVDTQNQDSGNPDPNNPDTGGTVPDNGGTQQNNDDDDFFQQVFEKNKAFADGLKDVIGQQSAFDIKATPQDQFRDLQAYRADLRQELAALNLDDLHDHDGNSIYRMQFRATVMPGQHKDKFGVARLSLQPPTLKEPEIREIYSTWLNHVNFRLSELNKTDLYTRLESAGLLSLAIVYNDKNMGAVFREEDISKHCFSTTRFLEKNKTLESNCLLLAYPSTYERIGRYVRYSDIVKPPFPHKAYQFLGLKIN